MSEQVFVGTAGPAAVGGCCATAAPTAAPTAAESAVEPGEVEPAVVGPVEPAAACCGSAKAAAAAGACCDPVAKVRAVAAGAGCCG
jgi:hypothetical protein